MTLLSLGPVEREGLVSYLGRVVALDDRAAVRLQARGTVAGVWSGPPFGVLALRPVALLDPAEVDTTVSAQRLLEALQGLAGTGSSGAGLPASVLGPPWAAVLPPQGGWTLEAEVPVAVVNDQVGVAIGGFRRRVDLLPADGRTPAALEAVAEALWRAPSVGPVPMRAAHAASQLGFLGRDGLVSAYRSGGWVRLGCPGGSVLARLDEPGTLGGLGSFDVLGAFTPR
ncbi:MAG TPA: hypothetical protein VEV13_01085 [Candidatus Limnocylindria bacterium]|nr:hypothetical protein [Candidatus Limnocylindria bacterium]